MDYLTNITSISNLTSVYNLTALGNSTYKHNVTINQVAQYFHVNVTQVKNESAETKAHLFDLYEVYKTVEKEQLMAYKLVAYILGTLIVISNLTVVISSGLILRKGQQPKSTYLLLGNVSLADTIIGISIMFGASIEQNPNLSSNPLCIFQIGLLVCPAIVSIFSVGLIAVDRYIYILHGLYYQRWFNTTRVRMGIVGIWIIGIFLGFLPALGWRNTELLQADCIFFASLPALGWTGNTFTNYRCWYIAVFPRSLLIIMSIIVLSVIGTVCVLYFLILRQAVKTCNQIKEFKETNRVTFDNKSFQGDRDETSQNTVSTTMTVTTDTTTDSCVVISTHELTDVDAKPCKVSRFKQKFQNFFHYYTRLREWNSHPSKLKAVGTVLLITLCFVGTWAPYYIAIIVYVNCNITKNGYQCVPIEVLTLGPLYMLGICNSLCDPIIYAWRHSGFKRTLKRLYLKYVWKKRL